MKGLNPSPATTPSRGDRHPLQGHPNASFPPVQGLFLLGKSFLGSGVEGSLSLQPGSRAAPCSRGRRQGVLMQARETRSPWPSGLQLQARGRGATPALALAGPEPDPLPAGVIAQLRVPAGRRRTPRSERTAGPGDRGAGDGSRCSRAAPRRPAGARGPRWELRFISFSLLLLLGSSPLGRSDAGAPREPHTPHTTRGGGVGAEDSEVHPRLPGLGLRVSPHSAAAHTPLLGWPSPLPSASPARPRCPSVASTALTLCSCRNRCTKGRGAGVGGRVRGAGRELAASAGPRPIRSAPSPCPAGGPWAAAAAGRSREQSGEQAEGRPRRGLSSLAMPPWGAALALLLAALALLALRLRRPSRRAVGARTLPGARSEDHGEVDGGGPAGQLSDGREPLPGGCRLICKPSALAQCLLRALRRSAALEPGPLPWLFGPHLQTLCHFVLPVGPGSELAREYLQLADDGLVALDWVVGPGARGRRATNAGGLPAVLLVIPNAWGRLTRNVLGLCLLALERGYYPVIFHRRGHHGCPLVSPRLQPFGDPSDLKEAITYIRFRHPATPLFAVSEGSGSALLLSYLGECGSSSYVTGAACISPVLRCREWFEAGLPWPYERGFLLHQKIALSRYATALEDTVDTGKLFRSRSLREFEEALFCHTKSFPISWDTYWDHNDPLRDVDEAAVPVLCICSADDPVCGPPSHFLPTELFHSNPYFFLLLSRHGGHCGFLRQEPLPAWSHDVTLEYFRALTDFFRTEERMKGLSKHRASFLAGRRRWGTLPKREVSPSSSLEEIFSWKRSYTR